MSNRKFAVFAFLVLIGNVTFLYLESGYFGIRRRTCQAQDDIMGTEQRLVNGTNPPSPNGSIRATSDTEMVVNRSSQSPNKDCVVTIQHPVAGNVMLNIKPVGNIFQERPGMRYEFRNVTTPELRQEISTRVSWSSDIWEKKVDELFKKNTNGSWVMLALINQGMLEMTMNYLASLALTGYEKFVIMCFDSASYTFLAELGYIDRAAMIPRSWIKKDIDSKLLSWNDQNYFDLLQSKLIIIYELLKRRHSLFYNDIDIVFLNSHVVDYVNLEDWENRPDIWYMVDATKPVMNGGFWFCRPTPETLQLFNLTYHYSTTVPSLKVDQYALEYVFKNDMKSYFVGGKVRPLSKALFPTGYFLKANQDINQRFQIYPMVAHVNWFTQYRFKKKFLKDKNMWYIGEVFANSSSSLRMGA